MEVGGDNVFELEFTSTTEEVSTHVVTLNSVIRQKLFYLPNPKASIARTSVKYVCMELMMLLENIDARTLKESP